MADQQQATGLHPFVTKSTILDLSGNVTQLTSEEWCSPIIDASDRIFTCLVNTDQECILHILTPQAHEDYYGDKIARDQIGPVIILDMEPVLLCPELSIDRRSSPQRLYLLANLSTGYNLRAYDITSPVPGQDIDLKWTQGLGPDSPIVSLKGPELRGISFNDTYVTLYEILDTDDSGSSILRLTTWNKAGTAFPAYSPEFTLDFGQLQDVRMIHSTTEDRFYIICTLTSGKVYLATADFTGIISGFSVVSPQMTPGMRAVAPGLTPLDGFAGLTFAFNHDSTHSMQIAYAKHLNTDADSGISKPSYWILDKSESFGETPSPNQSNMILSVCSNPNNTDFTYAAYITGTQQIRVVKLYRVTTGEAAQTHVPVIMWATRLGAITATVGTEQRSRMVLIMDQSGLPHVINYGNGGLVDFWTTREYILDLGHTVSSITADVETIPNMLIEITEDYASPDEVPPDVTITDISDDGQNIVIEFGHLNYTYLHGLGVDIELRDFIVDTLIQLYQGSYVDVLNLDKTLITIDGTDTVVTLTIPTKASTKPCVLRGTEVVRFRPTSAVDASSPPVTEIIPIEMVEPGDMLLIHTGQPCRVLQHLVTSIRTRAHNAPYFVPRNFFGEGRPYRPLLISGDHGILAGAQRGGGMSRTVVYAEDIKVLGQRHIGKIVEYHHLIMDNHRDSFYLANGLEVDSFHPTPHMRGR